MCEVSLMGNKKNVQSVKPTLLDVQFNKGGLKPNKVCYLTRCATKVRWPNLGSLIYVLLKAINRP